MKKTCSRCNKEKDDTDFNWKNIGIRRQSHCKICQSELTRDHYKRNPNPYKERAHKSNEITRDRNHKLILEYLADHPCVDCGESDPVVLDFDHVMGKDSGINPMINHGSVNEILEEIKKCEVRCSNCHRKRHARLQKNYRNISL